MNVLRKVRTDFDKDVVYVDVDVLACVINTTKGFFK